VLGPDDVEHFLAKGYIKLRACFTPETANEYSKDIWGLLTIVLWSEVVHQGGATFVACDSVGPVARFLAAHPEGIRPGQEGPGFPYPELIGQCTDYAEATGEVGDVYLIHPLVLHTMSPNVLRRPRFITNSTLRLGEPMRFNRPDPADHSPVERAILRALGVERFDFTATGPRERVVAEPL